MVRPCSRPLCQQDAEVVMRFDYDARHVLLDWSPADHDPNHMELCGPHADRFSPPRGWTVEDLRAVPGALYVPGRQLVPRPLTAAGHLPRTDLPRAVTPATVRPVIS